MQMWPEGLAGIEIKVDGFSHKLPLLVDYIFQQLVSLKVDPAKFDRVREGLIRRYKNANFKPDKHATYLRIYAIKQKIWPVEEVLAQLESLTPATLQGQPSISNAALLLQAGFVSSGHLILQKLDHKHPVRLYGCAAMCVCFHLAT